MEQAEERSTHLDIANASSFKVRSEEDCFGYYEAVHMVGWGMEIAARLENFDLTNTRHLHSSTVMVYTEVPVGSYCTA